MTNRRVGGEIRTSRTTSSWGSASRSNRAARNIADGLMRLQFPCHVIREALSAIRRAAAVELPQTSEKGDPASSFLTIRNPRETASLKASSRLSPVVLIASSRSQDKVPFAIASVVGPIAIGKSCCMGKALAKRRRRDLRFVDADASPPGHKRSPISRREMASAPMLEIGKQNDRGGRHRY